MKTGIEIIAAERQRQIEQEGWTPEHDAEHVNDEMALAASAYALPDYCRHIVRYYDGYPNEVSYPRGWPWDPKWWKPCPGNRIKELAKAGALIAAEIDRLMNAEMKTHGIDTEKIETEKESE